MIRKIIRKILAIVVGLITGSLFNLALIKVSAMIYAPEGGVDFNDQVAMQAYVASLPVAALLLVLAAHGGGSFVGGAVCALIAGQKWILGAVLVGGTFLLGGIMMLSSVPAPIWFAVIDVLLYVPLAILGCAAASSLLGFADNGEEQ